MNWKLRYSYGQPTFNEANSELEEAINKWKIHPHQYQHAKNIGIKHEELRDVIDHEQEFPEYHSQYRRVKNYGDSHEDSSSLARQQVVAAYLNMRRGSPGEVNTSTNHEKALHYLRKGWSSNWVQIAKHHSLSDEQLSSHFDVSSNTDESNPIDLGLRFNIPLETLAKDYSRVKKDPQGPVLPNYITARRAGATDSEIDEANAHFQHDEDIRRQESNNGLPSSRRSRRQENFRDYASLRFAGATHEQALDVWKKDIPMAEYLNNTKSREGYPAVTHEENLEAIGKGAGFNYGSYRQTGFNHQEALKFALEDKNSPNSQSRTLNLHQLSNYSGEDSKTLLDWHNKGINFISYGKAIHAQMPLEHIVDEDMNNRISPEETEKREQNYKVYQSKIKDAINKGHNLDEWARGINAGLSEEELDRALQNKHNVWHHVYARESGATEAEVNQAHTMNIHLGNYGWKRAQGMDHAQALKEAHDEGENYA